MRSDSAYEIEVTGAEGVPDVDADAIRRAVEGALRHRACARAQISVALIDDDAIAELNQRFLGHEGSTDVLSFDLSDAPDSGAVDGEVVISADTARREAAARRHPAAHELLLYAVHGTLHLLGMDDQTEIGAAEMHAIENEILTGMGIGPVYGAEPR
ncbi:MAG: rRNA maturation RNase YbeY [Phycisphaerales bacterium]|nr:rRNA maturation RNase YbeY [Phycisphaerales bacterium]